MKNDYKNMRKIYDELKFGDIISNHKKFIKIIKSKINLKGEIFIFFGKDDKDEYKDKINKLIKEHDLLKKFKNIMDLQFNIKEYSDVQKIIDYGKNIPSTLFFLIFNEKKYD